MPDFETLSRVSSPPFRLTGWHVGGIALVFFMIVATMNGVMMRHAFRTMPGLDARNGYDVSQRFNASINDARIQAARGWRSELAVKPTESATLISAAINDQGGKPIRGLIVSMAIRHPATRHFDMTAIAEEIAPGLYQISQPTLIGNWDIEISVTEGQGSPPFILSRNRIALKG